jgi:hypothetical protein
MPRKSKYNARGRLSIPRVRREASKTLSHARPLVCIIFNIDSGGFKI